MIGRRLPPALMCLGSIALAACTPSKTDPDPKPSESTTGTAANADSAKKAPLSTKAARPLPPAPWWLPELKIPSDNVLSSEKVALGKQLFFDKRLSKDGTAACETCHHVDKGWTDGTPVSAKVGGALNTRHSPTLYNVGYNDLWYWDGRAVTVEKVTEAAWRGQLAADPTTVAAEVAKIPQYDADFKAVFGQGPTAESIIKALASFLRTLRSGEAPWDRYEKGEKKAVSEEAIRGAAIFSTKAACAGCHTPPMYTDNDFHNVGIGFDKPEPDLGRGKITKDDRDNGAFKTPSLRFVASRAPYFHDGRTPKLEEAVDYMLGGGTKAKNPNLDARLHPVKLTPGERADLLAFLRSLGGPPEPFEAPTLPK